MNYLFVLPKSAAKSSGGYNIFPVGITYVTAYLKKRNFNLFTENLEFYSEDTFQILNDLIHKHKIDVVVTSGLSRDYCKIKEIVDTVKVIKSNIITAVGGGIISGDPESAMLALGADIGMIGEGEITAAALATALDNGSPYINIPGIIYKNTENGYTITSMNPNIIDINEIPIPDYDGFNYAAFMKSVNYSYAYVIASRSCPFRCTFCFHPSGTKYRQRTLDNLFIEIDYLINKYNVTTIGISDEMFAGDRKRVIAFCKRIAGYPVTWTVQMRVSDVDNKMLKEMVDSGCICISYGIESANNSILKSMKKHITVEQVDLALKWTYDNNMEIQGGLIFGDEAETQQSVKKSLDWYETNAKYALELNMINIFPGSELYKNACKNNLIKDKVQYLKNGCPLINVSNLTAHAYKDLSSHLYEKNMRVKNPPKIFDVKNVKPNHECIIEMICNKCGTKITVKTDVLHIYKVPCHKCRQRHYVDPYEKITHSESNMSRHFQKTEEVAIWGAGEICIKLLDNFKVFHNDNFKIIDIAKSRQGYSICGKTIYPTNIIDKNKIKKVIIAIVKRKDEVLKQITEEYPSVEHLYIPGIGISSGNIVSTVDEIRWQ